VASGNQPTENNKVKWKGNDEESALRTRASTCESGGLGEAVEKKRRVVEATCTTLLEVATGAYWRGRKHEPARKEARQPLAYASGHCRSQPESGNASFRSSPTLQALAWLSRFLPEQARNNYIL
jgi:hypothetical protein